MPPNSATAHNTRLKRASPVLMSSDDLTRPWRRKGRPSAPRTLLPLARDRACAPAMAESFFSDG